MCFHRPRLKQRTKLMHSPLSSSPSPSFPCPSSELCLKTKLAESVSGDDNTAGNAPKTYQTLVTEIKLWDTKQHPLTHNNNQQKQTPPQKKPQNKKGDQMLITEIKLWDINPPPPPPTKTTTNKLKMTSGNKFHHNKIKRWPNDPLNQTAPPPPPAK